jgi:hypothetical protein
MKPRSTLLPVAFLFACVAAGVHRKAPSPVTRIGEYPLRASTSAPAAHPLAPTAPTPVSAGELELRRALESGDLCATARLVDDVHAGAERISAYVAVTAPGAGALEIYGPEGAFLAPDLSFDQLKTSAARAAWVARLGGLAYTSDALRGGRNMRRSRELFLELEKKEPGNAFYPYLRLTLERVLDYKPERLKETAESVAAGSYFDTHRTDTLDELWEASWTNPALHYAFSHTFDPSPFELVLATETIENLQESALVTQRDADKIAALLAQEALHARRPSAQFGYDRTRLNMARRLDHRGTYPSPEALDKRILRGDPPSEPAVPWRLEQVGAACDPTAYEQFFYEQRQSR